MANSIGTPQGTQHLTIFGYLTETAVIQTTLGRIHPNTDRVIQTNLAPVGRVGESDNAKSSGVVAGITNIADQVKIIIGLRRVVARNGYAKFISAGGSVGPARAVI
jgi:hypothetical protein